MGNIAIVISGPSGVGKDTIMKEYLKRNQNLYKLVTYTTRDRRDNEIEGIDAIYIRKEKFEELISLNYFLEYNFYNGNYYGTPYSEMNKLQFSDIITTPSLSAAEIIKRNYPDACLVFVVPPSYKEWLSRFGNRDRNRLNIAINEFLIAESICDYFIINDKLEDAVFELEKIVDVHRNCGHAKKKIKEFISIL